MKRRTVEIMKPLHFFTVIVACLWVGQPWEMVSFDHDPRMGAYVMRLSCLIGLTTVKIFLRLVHHKTPQKSFHTFKGYITLWSWIIVMKQHVRISVLYHANHACRRLQQLLEVHPPLIMHCIIHFNKLMCCIFHIVYIYIWSILFEGGRWRKPNNLLNVHWY